jgi:wyosine [tRNA(Phe)-imidazoG37] synthetase (radical SAM superfamily)
MSLGIDTIPQKTCNWNCVYCQLGRTAPLRTERAEYVPVETILGDLDQALGDLEPGGVDWVTFVGSGEPLLHSRMGDLVQEVRLRTDHPVAVITNGSLLSRAEIQDELLEADAVLPTLDAGTPDLFKRLNRPHPGISFRQHVAGLASFRRRYTGRLLVEIMLVRGMNDSEEELHRIAVHLSAIQPDEVHISLPERPPAEEWVRPGDAEGLMRASAIFGDVSKVLSPGGAVLALKGDREPVKILLDVIGRHPLSHAQLMHALAGVTEVEKARILRSLAESGRAKAVRRHGHQFWVSASASFPGEQKDQSR